MKTPIQFLIPICLQLLIHSQTFGSPGAFQVKDDLVMSLNPSAALHPFDSS